MKTNHIIAVFVVVFYALLMYAHNLKVQVALEESKLTLANSEKKQLVDTEYSLKKDIERARKLEADINSELLHENDMFELLTKSLNIIQTKLEGSDRLERAVSTLEKEYGELVIEVKLLEGMRK